MKLYSRSFPIESTSEMIVPDAPEDLEHRLRIIDVEEAQLLTCILDGYRTLNPNSTHRLDLPPDVKIIRAWVDPEIRCMRIMVRSSEFAPVREGAIVPSIAVNMVLIDG